MPTHGVGLERLVAAQESRPRHQAPFHGSNKPSRSWQSIRHAHLLPKRTRIALATPCHATSHTAVQAGNEPPFLRLTSNAPFLCQRLSRPASEIRPPMPPFRLFCGRASHLGFERVSRCVCVWARVWWWWNHTSPRPYDATPASSAPPGSPLGGSGPAGMGRGRRRRGGAAKCGVVSMAWTGG